MPSEADDQNERIARIEQLVHRLSTELESVREEGRVASEAMSAFSKSKAEKSARARQASAAARRRAAARGARTRKRTRRAV